MRHRYESLIHIMAAARIVVLLAAVSTGAACDRSEDTAPVADLAIDHVTDGATQITLDDSAFVEIGTRDADPGHALHIVHGAILLDQDHIAVANSGSLTVRVFDETGRMVHEFGRWGEGPGEFGLLTSIMPWAADSIAAWTPGFGD